MIKRFWSDLKVQVGNSWAITLIVMLLLVLSFGVAFLSSQVIEVSPGLAQTNSFSDIPLDPPSIGWCSFMDGSVKTERLVGTVAKTARQLCEEKNQKLTSSAYNQTYQEWLAFCPGDTGNCNCATPGVQKSPKLEEAIGSRDGLINDYNDGDLSNNENNKLAFLQAAALNLRCTCPIIPSDISAKQRTSSPKQTYQGESLWEITAGPIDSGGDYRYKDQGVIIGIRELIQEYGKLRSRMLVFDETAFQCNGTWPSSRIVGSNEQSCNISSSYRSESTGSLHRQGRAWDIACNIAASNVSSGETCTGIAKEMLDAIEGAGSGFEIIKECSRAERDRYASGENDRYLNQVIHLEI